MQRNRERRIHSFTHLWLQSPKLSLSGARSLELLPILSQGCRILRLWAFLCWFTKSYFFKIYFIFIASQIYREEIHSLSDCKGQCCANPKPGAKNFLHVPHAGIGTHSFVLSSIDFPGYKQECEVGLPELDLAPIWDSGMFKERTLAARLLCCADMWSPLRR